MLYSSRSGDVGPGKYGQVVSSGKKTWRGGGESFSVPLVAPGVVGFLFCMQIMSFHKSFSHFQHKITFQFPTSVFLFPDCLSLECLN